MVLRVHHILVLFLCGIMDYDVCVKSARRFQYPCGTDICTFPEQFCSSRVDRCNECRFECGRGDRDIPLGCKQFCSPETTKEDQNQSAWYLNAWFVICCVLFGAIVVLGCLFCRGFITKRQTDSPNRQEEKRRTSTGPDDSKLDTESEMESLASRESNDLLPNDEDCYAEGRLKGVNPTSDNQLTSQLATSHAAR